MLICGPSLNVTADILLTILYNNDAEMSLLLRSLRPEHHVLSHRCLDYNPLDLLNKNLMLLIENMAVIKHCGEYITAGGNYTIELQDMDNINAVVVDYFPTSTILTLNVITPPLEIYKTLEIFSSMSMLAELLSRIAGTTQFTLSLLVTGCHLNEKNKQLIPKLPGPPLDPYETNKNYKPFELCMTESVHTFINDLSIYMDEPLSIGYRSAFIRKVAVPMAQAKRAYDDNQFEEAAKILARPSVHSDWTQAGLSFVEKRLGAS